MCVCVYGFMLFLHIFNESGTVLKNHTNYIFMISIQKTLNVIYLGQRKV